MDPMEEKCPHCNGDNPDPAVGRSFSHQFASPWWKQILYFVMGFVGLQLVSTVVAIIVSAAARSANPGATAAEINTPLNNLIVNSTTYLVLGTGCALLIWKRWPKLLSSFKKGIPYLAAILGFVVMIAFEMMWGVVSEAIFKIAGIKVQSNANQQGLNSMIVAIPALSIFVFGIVGPFVEEIAYRCGLFSFLCRVSKVFAYVVASLIFAFIHFDWTALWNPAYNGAAIVEIVNLPPYIFAGITFCFLYDRFGFCASFGAHAINNLFSVIMSLYGPKQ